MPSVEHEALIRAAIQAPSSHNAQPWRFRIDGEAIELLADPGRRLPVNDPDDRELLISCGCALVNLELAAWHRGHSTSTQVLPDGDDEETLARLTLLGRDEADESPLFDAIEKRASWRSNFSGPVTDAQARQLVSAARREDAWLEPLDPDARSTLADLVDEGNRTQWADSRWRRELAAWMRGPDEEDGLAVRMPAFSQWMVRTFNLGRRVARSDRRRLLDAPLVVVLGTDDDEAGDRLAAGKAVQRVLLTATGFGMGASWFNQPVQLPDLRTRLREQLDLPGVPQLVLAIGPVSGSPPARRRRPPLAVIAHD